MGRDPNTVILYSIGHSNRSAEHIIGLLKLHGIQAVADVRSVPYSRHNPQFSSEALEHNLNAHGLSYVFLGKELGGLRREPECYHNHQVDYERVAKLPAFQEGMRSLVDLSSRMKVAMLCAEQDPFSCHRTLLIARHIRGLVGDVLHIFGSGNIETQAQIEERLLLNYSNQDSDLFTTREDLIAEAYRKRAKEISYKEPVPHE